MVNRDLLAVPSCELAPGLSLHWYEPGNEKWWVAIHKLADRFNESTTKLFAQQFANPKLRLSERQCYFLDKLGHPVATATAWAECHGRFAGFGRVHWVAVVPARQNQGIGGMLVSTVCQRLVSLGYTRAFLTTSTLRPAAIHLYQKSGFRIENSAGQPDPAAATAVKADRPPVSSCDADQLEYK
jgi:GNAT superfamily N-acetyltransferase